MPGKKLLFKVDLDGDIRRLNVEEGADFAETWSNLTDALQSGFGIREASALSLKYKDDEGDLCTLVKDTIGDCLQLADGNNVRLHAVRMPEKAQHGKTPQAIDRSSTADVPPGLRPVAEVARPTTKTAESSGPSTSGYSSGCRGVGPWKLLACLSSLRAADMMSGPMVASLMLQFLPIMAQRAHRKQEKLNHIGAGYQEMLQPLLQRVLTRLDTLPGAEVARPGLEAFASGRDASRLGDCFATLLKAMVAVESKVEVAQLLKDASEELLIIIPNIFSKDFTSNCPPVAEHEGTRCGRCNVEPIRGPRFHSAAGALQVCGICFIDYPFDGDAKFECQLTTEGEGSDRAKAWKQRMKAGGKWKEHSTEAWEEDQPAENWADVPFTVGYSKRQGKNCGRSSRKEATTRKHGWPPDGGGQHTSHAAGSMHAAFANPETAWFPTQPEPWMGWGDGWADPSGKVHGKGTDMAEEMRLLMNGNGFWSGPQPM